MKIDINNSIQYKEELYNNDLEKSNYQIKEFDINSYETPQKFRRKFNKNKDTETKDYINNSNSASQLYK